MPPKDAKKKKAKKATKFQVAEADLLPFGVKAGQLVRNALGCAGVVLGVRAAAGGEPLRLWVRYESGLEAPIDADGLQPCGAVEQLRGDIQQRRREQQALDAKWAVYNAEQARKEAEVLKAAARQKKKKAAAAVAVAEQARGDEPPLQPRGSSSRDAEAAVPPSARSIPAAA